MANSTTPTFRLPKPPLADVGDRISPNDPLFGVVWINPDRMSGVACFAGTRVPVQTLFDYLEAGDGLPCFLDDFEGVTHEQAIAVLEFSRERLFEGLIARESSA